MITTVELPTRNLRRRVMPGFGLSVGYAITWLSLIVLIPVVGIFIKSAGLGWHGLWAVWTEPRVLSALKVSFGTALAAAAFNAVAGTLVAWVFVRYDFFGKRLFDAMIDLPFALPTAVAGISLTALYGGNGWIGQWLEQPAQTLHTLLPMVTKFIPVLVVLLLVGAIGWRSLSSRVSNQPIRGARGALGVVAGVSALALLAIALLSAYSFGMAAAGVEGIKVVYTKIGITVALVFIGLPFVVRVVQPVLAEVEVEFEEAAASLGAGRLRTVWSVVLPAIWPAVLSGFGLAFARGVGEYGSVIFIAGNLPGVSEIAPLLITIKLEEFDYAGAAAIAAAMLLLSFGMLLIINTLQARLASRGTKALV